MSPGLLDTVYGKAFVVRRGEVADPYTPTELWPDMVAESDVYAADRRKYMDPDVFILPDGTVVMLAGCERFLPSTTGTGFDAYGGDPLGRFEGDMADLTWPWSDAFTL